MCRLVSRGHLPAKVLSNRAADVLPQIVKDFLGEYFDLLRIEDLEGTIIDGSGDMNEHGSKSPVVDIIVSRYCEYCDGDIDHQDYRW